MAATLGFVFTAAWSELLFALMLISSNDDDDLPGRPAHLRLQVLGRLRADDGGRRAGADPGAAFFLLIQRYLVQGLTAGAVKG